MAVADASVGQVIAGYRLEEVVGRGGMGVVYRATHIASARPFAVKVLAPDLADDPAFRRRFVGEARAASAIESLHVLPVHDAGEQDGRLYLTMPFVDGPDLAALLRRDGAFTPRRAVDVVGQLADALDAAHRGGLVHRDVKPANVLMDGTHAYLADFGLTKRSSSQTGATATGQWVGTLSYVAPEQIRGDPVDGRADVYALGCVLHELLTGSPPFPRDTDVATLWAHIADPPPAPAATDATIPVALDSVVARAMAKDPADRYATAGELATAAAAALTGAVSGRPVDRAGLRRGAVGAFGFVTCMVGYYFLPLDDAAALGTDPTAAQLLDYYVEDREALLWRHGALVLGIVLLLGFVRGLPTLMHGRTRPRGSFPGAVRAAGALGVVSTVLSSATALAPTFQLAADGRASAVVALSRLSLFLAGLTGVFLAVFFAGCVLLGLRHGARWSTACCAAAAGAAAVFAIGCAIGNNNFVTVFSFTSWTLLVGVLGIGMVGALTGGRGGPVRWAAGGGVLFVFLIGLTFRLPYPVLAPFAGAVPTDDELVRWYAEVGPALLAEHGLRAFAVVVGLGFWWSLDRILRRGPTWAGYALGAAVAGAAFWLTSLALGAAPAVVALEGGTISALVSLERFSLMLSDIAHAVAAGVGGVVALRARVFPRWLAVVGIVAGAVLLVAALAQVAAGDAVTAVADRMLFALLAWVGAASIAILTAPRATAGAIG